MAIGVYAPLPASGNACKFFPRDIPGTKSYSLLTCPTRYGLTENTHRLTLRTESLGTTVAINNTV